MLLGGVVGLRRDASSSTNSMLTSKCRYFFFVGRISHREIIEKMGAITALTALPAARPGVELTTSGHGKKSTMCT